MEGTADIEKMSVAELKEKLRGRGLSVKGSKEVLCERLKDATDTDVRVPVGNAEVDISVENEDNDVTVENNENRQELEGTQEVQDTVNPEDSVSQLTNSSRSSKSSRMSKIEEERVMAAANQAALMAEAKFLDEELKLEEMERRYNEQKRRLQLNIKIARASARQQALEAYDGKSNVSKTSGSVQTVARHRLNANAETFQPALPIQGKTTSNVGDMNNYKVQLRDNKPKEPNDNPTRDKESTDRKLMETLATCNLKGLMPKVGMPTFNGDATRYRSFIRAFDMMISERLASDEEKLLFLEEYTSGVPKDMVITCLNMPPDEGYKEARSMLQMRYGREELISTSYINKIMGWPALEDGDVESFHQFTLTLVACKNTLRNGETGAKEIELPSTIRKIMRKLPFPLQEKWRGRADDIEFSQHRGANFSDFVEFVSRQNRIMSNPVFGRHIVDTDDKTTKTDGKAAYQGSVQSKARVHNTTLREPEHLKVECLFCNKGHYLDECQDLMKIPPEERREFVFQNSLCFGCLRRGHLSKECRRRKYCDICKGRHPTILHRPPLVKVDPRQPEVKAVVTQSASGTLSDQNDKKDTVRVNTGKVINAKDSYGRLSIIPVKVRDSNGKLIPTYAFIDNGSTASFCTRKLLGRLAHQGVKPTQLSISTVLLDESKADSHVVTGVEICDPDENNFVLLPPIYTLDKIPGSKEDIIRKGDLENWPHLESVDLPDFDVDIGLLLGSDVISATEPIEVIPSISAEGPFAVRTKLGWIVHGQVRSNHTPHVRVNRIKVEEITLDDLLVNMYNQEFKDVTSAKRGLSEEDRRWMVQVEESCRVTDTGHYEIGMPFRDRVPPLPNNKGSVVRRLEGLKRRFMRDERFYKDYCAFMSDMMERNYAEEVPETKSQYKDAWYIPHHGVYHHQKTDQLRVVFDCAAKHQGSSLNDVLMQGPDLTTPLVEVLIKFRQGPQAFMADIKSMFYQVSVPEKDRDYMRFLWWPNGNFHEEPKEYRMTVHPFGAKSSPSCANFALRKTVTDNSMGYDPEAKSTILHNFYVDDCLKSMQTEEELVKVAHEVKALCKKGGFDLTKFVGNSRKLLESLPMEYRGKKVKELNLCQDSLPMEKALGIGWDIEADTLTVSIKDKDKPLSKRGLLSTIGAMYDPLGMVSPYLLQGRLIMQDLCRLNIGWDELIPEEHQVRWKNWKNSMPELCKVSLDRCVMPSNFGDIVSSQIHHFSDASEKGYGTSSYLRLCNSQGKVHCAFLFGKSHVAPLKAVTIPRLELMAAVSAVRVNSMITNALEIPVQRTVFWTDSTTVLRYIRNDRARFHTFVANRLAAIRDGSQPTQWRYVNSEFNPADDASRGSQSERWLKGPQFLYESEGDWPEEPLVMKEENLEIKSIVGASKCNDNKAETDPIKKLLHHYSSWHMLKRAVAWMLRLKNLLSKTKDVRSCTSRFLTVKELEKAEMAIIQNVQKESFSAEMLALSKEEVVKKNSPTRKLNPMLSEGLLRVGGRLSEVALSLEVKHPIILPGSHHIARIIIRDCHDRVGHQGREHVLSSLREKYWIIKGNSAVRKVIQECIKCRKYQAPVMQQLMSNLPGDAIIPCEPPFTSTGVDCFGPFFTKRGRSEVKRYGVIFTCLTIHAIHIEVAESLSTDSFINALRRFIARRGQVKSIHCDRGTNFVGAERELREAVDGWNQSDISKTLLLKNIDWRFNPPHASHFGGVWERQIRTVRKVLNALMREQVLNDEGLRTLMCEVEAVINSRPITNNSSDCQDAEPLTPNHLLVMKNGPLLVGVMEKEDMYCRKRWRHVQYLADLFWKRWKKEYLLTLQERQKWHVKGRNLSVGDVVLMTEENSPRCQWPMGRVISVKRSRDGLVRSAILKSATTTTERPLSKLVMLCENTDE